MDSKMFLLSFFLLFSSPVSLGLSPNLDQQGGGGGGGGGGGDESLKCLQKLMPCQPYLKSVSSPPPSTCCVPLKEMVLNDARCLCKIFNNSQLLGRFNITQADALKLPKACGATIDWGLCKQVADSPSGSPATPATPSSPSNSSSASNTTTIKSAANWNVPLEGSSFIILLVVNLGLIFQSIQKLY